MFNYKQNYKVLCTLLWENPPAGVSWIRCATNHVITHLGTLQKGKTAPDFLIFLKTGFEIVN